MVPFQKPFSKDGRMVVVLVAFTNQKKTRWFHQPPWPTSSATETVKRSSKARVRCSCSRRPKRSSGTCHGTPTIDPIPNQVDLFKGAVAYRKEGRNCFFIYPSRIKESQRNSVLLAYVVTCCPMFKGFCGSNLMTQRSRRLAMDDWLSGLELSNMW
jgi:hypothetical protein